MSGIFPSAINGGLNVGTAENPIFPANVENAYRPSENFTVSCEITYLPSDCSARIAASQINSLQGELLCLAETLDPEGTWNCNGTCNIGTAFTNWLNTLAPLSTVAVQSPYLLGDGTAIDPVRIDPLLFMLRQPAGVGVYTEFDALSSRILNLDDGIAATDAVNKGQLDRAVSANDVELTYVNATTLALVRRDGTRLMINGVATEIPAAGLTITNAGLATSTLYYVYAQPGPSLLFSTNSHVQDATTGMEVESTNAAHTLVGLVRTNASSQFVFNSRQKLVRSYFNRKAIVVNGAFTAARSTTSLTSTELNTEIRNEWVQFAGEAVSASIIGSSTTSVANVSAFTQLGWDGTGLGKVNGNASATALAYNAGHTEHRDDLSEGFHYATVLGNVQAAATGTWNGGTGNTSTFMQLGTRIGK